MRNTKLVTRKELIDIKCKIQCFFISISEQQQLITNIKPHTVKQILNVMQFIIFYIYFNITVSIMSSHITLLLCLYLKFSFCKMAR